MRHQGAGKEAAPPPVNNTYPHFMRDVYRTQERVTPLSAVWTGVKVLWWPNDGRALVVMPTDAPSRVIIVGTPFVPVPKDLRILIPYVGKGNVDLKQGMKYKDVRDQIRRRPWVSMHTADPYHILIDWEVGATLGPGNEVQMAESIIDVPDTGSQGRD